MKILACFYDFAVKYCRNIEVLSYFAQGNFTLTDRFYYSVCKDAQILGTKLLNSSSSVLASYAFVGSDAKVHLAPRVLCNFVEITNARRFPVRVDFN